MLIRKSRVRAGKEIGGNIPGVQAWRSGHCHKKGMKPWLDFSPLRNKALSHWGEDANLVASRIQVKTHCN